VKLAASILLLSVLYVSTLTAAPIVALDLDPSTTGIQTSLSTNIGDVFTIDVVVNLAANELLRGFEIDVDFDNALFNPKDVVDGGFLLVGSGLFEIEKDLFSPDVNFAETTLGVFGQGATGSGVLASITFEAIASGSSALDLNDVILAILDPTTNLITGVFPLLSNIGDGEVTVSAVPLPGALGFMLFGLASLVGVVKQKKLNAKVCTV
jgi:hypothetical protein